MRVRCGWDAMAERCLEDGGLPVDEGAIDVKGEDLVGGVIRSTHFDDMGVPYHLKMLVDYWLAM